MLNLETMLVDITNRNPHFVMITSDFNAIQKLVYLWHHNFIRSSFRFSYYFIWSQPINNRTKKFWNALLVSLTFISQPNLIRDFGIYPILHLKCHHQIIYSKPNLKIEYTPLYNREICDYNNAGTDLINLYIKTFDRPKLF